MCSTLDTQLCGGGLTEMSLVSGCLNPVASAVGSPFVWILSNDELQPTKRGVWRDSGMWSDTNVWQD